MPNFLSLRGWLLKRNMHFIPLAFQVHREQLLVLWHSVSPFTCRPAESHNAGEKGIRTERMSGNNTATVSPDKIHRVAMVDHCLARGAEISLLEIFHQASPTNCREGTRHT